jgi:putative ABC transport system permease protein
MARALERPRPSRLAAAPAAVGGLLRRLPRNHGALAIFGCIVLITSFTLAALPGYVNRMSDDGLRRSITDARSFERHLSVTQVGFQPFPATGTTPLLVRNLGDVEGVGATLQGAMPPIVQGAIERRAVVIDTPRWTLSGLPGTPPGGPQRFLQLRLQSDIDGRIRVVEGRLPAPRPPVSFREVTGTVRQESDVLLVYETAISRETAERLGVRVGDRLLAVADMVFLRAAGLRFPPANYRILVEFVGLIETIAPTDDYWLEDNRLQRPGVFENADVTVIYATGLLAPTAFGQLIAETSPEPWTYQWRYFVDAEQLRQDDLADFEAGIRRMGLTFSQYNAISTGLVAIAERFTGQRLFAVSVLALAAAGVAATALTVLGVLEGLVVALPAALLGGALALALLRPPDVVLPLLAALATAVAATVVLVAAIVPVSGQNLGAVARRQIDARRAAAPRLVLEGLVLILTVAGVVLLRRRGLLESGQLVDPYLVAVPILLGLACGIVVLRLLPLLAWGIDGLARRGRGLVGILTIRRLTRPTGAQLATLAILLAVALAVFATIVQNSIGTALSEDAWQQVGADYRADLPVAVAADETPTLDLGGIAGIEASARGDFYPVVPVTLSSVRLGDVALLAIEPEGYAAVAAGTPVERNLSAAALAPGAGAASQGSRENPLPAIISTLWVSSAVPRPGDLFALNFGGREVFFVAREARASYPGLAKGRPFVVTQFAALRAIERPPVPPLTRVYLRGGAQVAGPLAEAVRAQVPPVAVGVESVVTSRRAEYDRARGLPLVAGVSTGFLWGGAVMAALALGAVVAAAEQLGRQRSYEQGYLRLLGLRGGEARALSLLELLPPVALATLGGGLLGVAMIRILGPAIDLTSFAAPGQPIALQADWPTIALLVAAVIGVATGAGLFVGRRNKRAGSGELLREVNR